MTGQVPLSSKARIKAAKQAFEEFTGHEADIVDTVDLKEYDTAFVLGELTGLMYECIRDNNREHYLHEFKKSARPLLCVSHDGKQLIIAGGNYFVNEAGINDK